MVVDVHQFPEFLWQKGRELYRDMPWRRDTRPYYILVSELMLQQTQVARVVPKFEQFIARFPDEETLANASLADVLTQWQGLGYNRRAKFLHTAARAVVQGYDSRFPLAEQELLSLPGVGNNTAGAIMAYAHNQPSIFIETNIRTVYIHHFFADALAVTDAQITEKLAATLDHEHPREFYWALMDYGAHLKSQGVKTNSRSKHYKKQPKLEGSVRQVRGHIITLLTEHGSLTDEELRHLLAADERYRPALAGLLKDEIISVTHDRIAIE